MAKMTSKAEILDGYPPPRLDSLRAIVNDGDQEVLALRSNADFLAYLDACKSRARTQPRMTLAEIREHFGDDAGERPAD